MFVDTDRYEPPEQHVQGRREEAEDEYDEHRASYAACSQISQTSKNMSCF